MQNKAVRRRTPPKSGPQHSTQDHQRRGPGGDNHSWGGRMAIRHHRRTDQPRRRRVVRRQERRTQQHPNIATNPDADAGSTRLRNQPSDPSCEVALARIGRGESFQEGIDRLSANSIPVVRSLRARCTGFASPRSPSQRLGCRGQTIVILHTSGGNRSSVGIGSGLAAGILSPNPKATDGALCVTRREA